MSVAIRTDRVPLGIILILTSTMLVAAQEAVIKEATSTMSLWQMFVLRSAVLLPAFLALSFVWGDGKNTLRNAMKFWPWVRSGLFLLMYFSMYMVIQYVPLALIAAGVYTAPLFVILITTLLGIEKSNLKKWLAVLIGFIGVLIILKPGTDEFSLLLLSPIFGGLFYALVGIVTRTKCQDFKPTTLAVSLSIQLVLIGVLMSAFVVLLPSVPSQDVDTTYLTGGWGIMGEYEWQLIFALAILMFCNGLILPAAYQIAPTTIIATFDYSYMIFAIILGFVFFNEIPDALSFVGMALIVVAGLLITRSDRNKGSLAH